jgi:tetratricopeptide (TPR) repeat protein
VKNLSRRRQRVALTVGAAGAFVVIVTLVVWRTVGRREVYRPGEAIEGLTSELARSLPDDYPSVTFTDVTREAGIDFRHFFGRRSSQLPEDMGSGAAWGDYDGDGLPDLYVANLVGPLTLTLEELEASPARAALYRNQGDGTFTEVAEPAGVDHRGMGMAAAWADYDNDGHLDLFVSTYGDNVLYRNRGDGTFEDVSRAAGIAGHVGFWAGASWADYDRDGFLDLYVAGYVKYSPGAGGPTSLQYDVEVPSSLNPSSFRPERNLLFRNNGDGTFREVAAVAAVEDRQGRSLQAAWTDLDEDGWPDLYVANDVSDNVLFRNRGDGTFLDVSHGALVADYRGAMGLAVGDWDLDGDTDIFVTHWIAQENALYSSMRMRQAHPDGSMAAERPVSDHLQFMDEADRRGLGQIALDYIGFGTSFLDYDNDGRLDLFIANGSTFQRSDAPELLVPMLDQLMWNRGATDGFFDVSAVSGEYFGRELVGRGIAFADYDADGDLDVFVANNGGPGVLLRNDGGSDKHWLKIRLQGTRSNRSGIGARLRLVAGEITQTREVGAQGSYLSQHTLEQHFGLGPAVRIDTLEVVWPSGERQVVTGLVADRTVRVVEGEAVDEGMASAGSAEEWVAPVGARDDRTRADVIRFWELHRAATRSRIQGRAEEAAELYEAALALDSVHENTLYHLGSMRLQLGDLDGAASAWKRLVAVAPGSSRGHTQLGLLYSCLGQDREIDLARATTEFERALEINKEETGPLLRLAEVALLRDERDVAEDYLDALLRSNAKSVEAYFLKGYIQYSEGRHEEAATLFTAAVQAGRREMPAEPGLGEGETRSGLPMLAAPTTCLTPSTGARGLAELAEVEGADLSGVMGDRYRELGALVQNARSRRD